MKLLYFIASVLCAGLTLHAQSLTLKDFETRFEEELEKIVRSQQDKQIELKRNYMGALLRFETNAKRQGDLNGVEAAREEIRRVELEPSLVPSESSPYAEIARMQNLVRTSVREYRLEKHQRVEQLVQTVRGYIESASSNLVQQDKIEEAIAWRNWGESLEQRPLVAAALTFVRENQLRQEELENRPPDVKEFHPALRGDAQPFWGEKAKKFPLGPRAYVAGNEPEAKDRRLGTAKTPSAAGSGMTLLSGRVKLVEEEETTGSTRTSWSSSKEKSHLFVARVEFSPLPGKSLGRTLVVFDLYKRGSGSRREVIRTDQLLLPPVEAGSRVVVDAGPYRYESLKYRDEFGYRADTASTDEFYGYIVTFFNEQGQIYYQRATEAVLEDYARKQPPHVPNPVQLPEGDPAEAVPLPEPGAVRIERLGEEGPIVEIRRID